MSESPIVVSRLSRALVVGLICCSIAGNAQTNSTWRKPGSSRDWFDPANWTAGVPNGAGDQAQIPADAPLAPSFSSASPVTLGHLEFTGAGGTTLTGGQVVFQNPGESPAILSASPTPGLAIDARIFPAIVMAPDESLIVDVSSGGSLELIQGFGAGNGAILKRGTGNLVLTRGSQDYQGHVTVSEGTIAVKSPDALGAPSQGTLIDGGAVLLHSKVAEPFTLASGILQAMTDDLELTTPLMLPAESHGVVRTRQGFKLLGGTTGPGDLHIHLASFASVESQPLVHLGNVTLSGRGSLRLFVDNEYEGTTLITDGALLRAETPGALGGVANGTIVDGGTLWLHALSEESVSVQNGRLELWAFGSLPTAELTMHGRISLNGGELSSGYTHANLPRSYIVAQPLQIAGGQNRVTSIEGSLTLAAGIEGSGHVTLEGSDRYPLQIRGPISDGIGVEVADGTVRLQQQNVFAGDLVVKSRGKLLVEHDQQMHLVRLEHNGSTLEVVEGAVLRTETLDWAGGVLRGSIWTNHELRVGGYGLIQEMSHVDTGLDVRVESRELILNDGLDNRPPTNATIAVNSSNAVVSISPKSVTAAELHLNNGTGYNFGGALLAIPGQSWDPRTTLLGDIHLGDEGAYIGSGFMRIEGQIYGGDLNLNRRQEYGVVILAGQPTAYTGATRVFSGELTVAENAKLAETRVIEIYAGGQLHAESSAADGQLSDRLPDDVPIRMHGGGLGTWPAEKGVNSRERIGRLELQRGLNLIGGSRNFNESPDLLAQADLVIGEIVRERGAIYSNLLPERSALPERKRPGSVDSRGAILENPPPLVNGMLPAWFRQHSNFLTYDAEGRIRSYDGPFASLEQADETSIVYLEGDLAARLDTDKTIFALTGSDRSKADLGGKVLTVGSGGVGSAELFNGTLQPGAEANGELIVSNATINASIVDNAQPTSVVYAGFVRIGGQNSYSGTTYVVGGRGDFVEVTRAAALPAGTDLEISGSGLRLRDGRTKVTYQLGDIVIRDRGFLEGRCCGHDDSVFATSVLLEDGELGAQLVGAIPIVKQTKGTAALTLANPKFTGRIDVVEGVLATSGDLGGGGYQALGQGTVHVGPKGRLVLVAVAQGDHAAVPKVFLNGGALFGGGDLSWNLRGDVEVTQDSAIYLLDGLSGRPRPVTMSFDGNVDVHPGVTLRVIGGRLALSGTINLKDGSVLATDSQIASDVRIADGAVLSPGLDEGTRVGLMEVTQYDGRRSEMVWGKHGRLRWEINDVSGDLGATAGRGWDAIYFGSEKLTIAATPSEPFIIEPVALQRGGDLVGLVQGFDPQRSYRWQITEFRNDNTFGTVFGFAPDRFAFDVSTFRQVYPQVRAESFSMSRDRNALFLNYAPVPEPGALVMLSLLALPCLAARPLDRSKRASSASMHRSAGESPANA